VPYIADLSGGVVKVSQTSEITGWSPRCPNCGKAEAYWSGLIQGWLCSFCGLHGELFDDSPDFRGRHRPLVV
jgi:uncharacterized protein (DUF983 family)